MRKQPKSVSLLFLFNICTAREKGIIRRYQTKVKHCLLMMAVTVPGMIQCQS
jgi:hypothetical protein